MQLGFMWRGGEAVRVAFLDGDPFFLASEVEALMSVNPAAHLRR